MDKKGREPVRHFLSTHINRIDVKGRVSVPASFRTVLGADAKGVILIQSLADPAIDACAEAALDRLSANMDAMHLNQRARKAIETLIYGAAQFLPFDGEGRIMLPDSLRAAAGIESQVAFFGRHHIFQLWQPQRLDDYIAAERETARLENLTLAALLSQPSELQARPS